MGVEEEEAEEVRCTLTPRVAATERETERDRERQRAQQILSMIKWIRTSGLSMNNSLSLRGAGYGQVAANPRLDLFFFCITLKPRVE